MESDGDARAPADLAVEGQTLFGASKVDQSRRHLLLRFRLGRDRERFLEQPPRPLLVAEEESGVPRNAKRSASKRRFS
jgi:hypothetical protein